MKTRRHILLVALTCALLGMFLFRQQIKRPVIRVIQLMRGKKTVDDRLNEFGQAARDRLAPDFDRIGAVYPPEKMMWVGLKQEKRLEVWVLQRDGQYSRLKSYPILGASGALGPKLREGDRQVPEGIYEIESLNPNSLYHVAARLSYPNEFDRAKGAFDKREHLGSDIMIHGKSCSVGCLAMGDLAAEELFVLAAEAGIDTVSVVLSPIDFRNTQIPAALPDVPGWTVELYDSIKRELTSLK